MSHATYHGVEATSSIGAVWPPASSSHERLRGFYDQKVVETKADCQEFAELFGEQVNLLAERPELTRLSIRLVTYASHLATLHAMGAPVEAAIPLANTEPGLVLAYTATNKPSRAVDAATLQRHGRLLQVIVRQDRVPAGVPDYVVKTVDHHLDEAARRRLEAQFSGLYGAFNYGLEDVRELLGNPANTILYLEDNERVVSTALAERAAIPIAGFGSLQLAEISEAYTHPDYRGKGLYRRVSGALIGHLLAQQANDPLHAIYGESNLDPAVQGVLVAGHQNGRHFSHFDREAYDLPGSETGFGILQQNFKVADGREQRRYNDFAVSYLPLQSTGEQS
jgi:GNAT superfamily N-acetyltransferase